MGRLTVGDLHNGGTPFPHLWIGIMIPMLYQLHALGIAWG
jgi:hypothetical protein